MTRPRSSTSREDDGSLTPSDRQRRTISARLYQLRLTGGLTQLALAERLGVTQSMVSKLERGTTTPTSEMVHRIVQVLGLQPEVRDELLDLIAELAVQVNTLRVMHRRGGERSIQGDIAVRERSAREILDYQDEVVQGLLQVADYTRAMVPLIAPDLPDLNDLVAARAERQRVLYDSSKRFRFLLHESAIRARVAPVPVMRAQIDRLIYLAGAFPHVEIRVLPFAAPLDAWVMTSFGVMDDEVTVELQAGTVSIRDPREVALYRSVFEQLWARSLSGPLLVALLRDVDSWLAGLPG